MKSDGKPFKISRFLEFACQKILILKSSKNFGHKIVILAPSEGYDTLSHHSHSAPWIFDIFPPWLNRNIVPSPIVFPLF
jgi:hypothetical protein